MKNAQGVLRRVAARKVYCLGENFNQGRCLKTSTKWELCEKQKSFVYDGWLEGNRAEKRERKDGVIINVMAFGFEVAGAYREYKYSCYSYLK